MQNLIQKLRNARVGRYARLVDPSQNRFLFCPIWANYTDPPTPVRVDTHIGSLTITAAPIRSYLRENDICEYSFPFSFDARIFFHPPEIFVAHYNEIPQLAAQMQHAFVVVIPDARVGSSEWGEANFDAFFFAPARDDEPYEAQQARVRGLRFGLVEIWGGMVSAVEYIPKFSQRAAWETGEKLVKGEWFAIKITINIKDYELTAM